MGRTPLKRGHSRLNPVLTITVLPGSVSLGLDDGLVRLGRMRREEGKCAEGAGILTGFPFPCVG